MDVAIVCFANLRGVPYIYQYTNILKNNNINYDVFIWNRHEIDENIECRNLYTWNKKMTDDTTKKRKLLNMFLYSRYVENKLLKHNYNRVIILSSLPGIFMNKILKNKYANRYIFDIRDHSYEHIKIYKKLMDKVMKFSALNVISSEGFKEFLPKREAILCHNYSIELEPNKIKRITQNGIIKVSFIGQIRYANAYLDFIDKIANNQRIEFHFYGFGGDEKRLKSKCIEQSINNVFFHGSYLPQDKKKIIEDTDIIFNVYGNNLHVKYALSNKYYDALVYKRPLLVSDQTTMQDISKGIAYTVNQDFSVKGLLNWYDNLDYDKFCKSCDSYLVKVNEDRKLFTKSVEEIFVNSIY